LQHGGLQSGALGALAGVTEDDARAELDTLSDEQARVLERALGGESLFVTGAAGTGKSHLLRCLIRALQRQLGEEAVAVTGSTGMAAVNVGGCTLHSFAGVGVGRDTPEALARAAAASPAQWAWQACRVLVVDEISMVDAVLFDKLEFVARRLRGVERPFGGLQLILCGDFLQLPPIRMESGFCFEASSWERCGLGAGTVVLCQVHRQAGDEEFVALLRELRLGRCSEGALALLSACRVGCKAQPADGVEPTRLYCRNRDVDAENQACLAALEGELHVYSAKDAYFGAASSSRSAQGRLSQLAGQRVAGRLELKEGAQVVLVRSLGGPLANGSRGRVLACGERPLVHFDCGVALRMEALEFTVSLGGAGSLVRCQVPLRLGWALTVHKAQGMTLSRAEVLLEGAWDYGQAYVALSRVTSLAGLWLRSALSPSVVKAHPRVLQFYHQHA